MELKSILVPPKVAVYTDEIRTAGYVPTCECIKVENSCKNLGSFEIGSNFFELIKILLEENAHTPTHKYMYISDKLFLVAIKDDLNQLLFIRMIGTGDVILPPLCLLSSVPLYFGSTA